jgi:hypothetical protein
VDIRHFSGAADICSTRIDVRKSNTTPPHSSHYTCAKYAEITRALKTVQTHEFSVHERIHRVRRSDVVFFVFMLSVVKAHDILAKSILNFIAAVPVVFGRSPAVDCDCAQWHRRPDSMAKTPFQRRPRSARFVFKKFRPARGEF